MSISSEYLEWMVDQLGGLGPVTVRRMFGGAGIYHHSVMFGLVDDDVAYFKVADANRLDYVERGMKAFAPTPGALSTTWFEVPGDVLESPPELAEWARRAFEAASSSRERSPRKRKPSATAGKKTPAAKKRASASRPASR